MTDTLRALAREKAQKLNNSDVENLSQFLHQFAQEVQARQREATEAEIAADPDRYKGLKKRIIAQAQADQRESHASLVQEMEAAMKLALHEMRHTVAPRNSFTDAVDALDAALEQLALLRRSPAPGTE